MLCSVLRLKKAWKGVRTTFRKILFTPKPSVPTLTNELYADKHGRPPTKTQNQPSNYLIEKLHIPFYWKSSVQVVQWNFWLRNPRAIGLVTHGAKYNVSQTSCILLKLESVRRDDKTLVMGTGIRNTGLRANYDAVDSREYVCCARHALLFLNLFGK